MKYEWRVFFPCTPTKSTEQAEQVHIDALQSIFDEIPSQCEDRVDEYIVCKSYLGHKVRGGKKAEVKIRKEVHEPVCIELYEKHKLGKGKVSAYSSDIVQLLTSHNLFEDGDDKLLLEDSLKSVSISKARKGVDISDTCYLEICRIKVEGNDESEWISVCMEGESHKEIEELLRCSDNAAIVLTRQLIALHDPKLAESERLPVLSGYPTFVIHLTAAEGGSNEEMRGLIQRFNSYFATQVEA